MKLPQLAVVLTLGLAAMLLLSISYGSVAIPFRDVVALLLDLLD